MTNTKVVTLSEAVDRFMKTFNNVSGPMFADLIQANEGGASYDSSVLTLAASPTLMCNQCSETGSVEKKDVAMLGNEPIRYQGKYGPGAFAETMDEALEALEPRLDDFRDTVLGQDDREETNEEVRQRLREEIEMEHEKYVCGCGAVEDDVSMGEPVYAFPVAWNTMFQSDRFLHGKSDCEKAAEAGFFVFESEYYDGYILGVDGAGYSFKDSHFTPFYLALGLQWHTTGETVETVAD